MGRDALLVGQVPFPMVTAGSSGPSAADRSDSEQVCAILDASVSGHVFGSGRPRAGRQFFDWLETSSARLVVGGRLYIELARNRKFEKWAEVAIADGRLIPFGADQVVAEEDSLPVEQLRSDDAHVIALARIGRARILYSNDGALCEDFKDPAFVTTPRGRIYPTGESDNAARRRRNLLRRNDLCPNQ